MAGPGSGGLRRRLAQKEKLGALWLSIGSETVVELGAGLRPDAIVLDAQHGLWDRRLIERAVGAALPHAPVLVRTAENSAGAIGQALDAGAEGVIVPLVETDAEAAAAVAAARYPPQGLRSAGGIRPLAAGFADYYARANSDTVVGVMIETYRGVRQAASIAHTPGIDFVFVGTGDLALSLGTFPNPDPRHEKACRTVLEACRAAGVPCGIFTPNVEAAMQRREEGYAFTVVASDIDIVTRGLSSAVRRFAGEAHASSPDSATGGSTEMSADTLMRFASAIAQGQIKVIDLTQTLKPTTPVIQLPPPLAQSNPFRILEISRYDDRGPAWYWNNIALGEHTGTHFDAPCHWVTGKDNPEGSTDTVPVQRMIAPACVIDCSREVAANEKFLLEPAHIQVWEGRHGRIPDGSWVLMRTDWSKREDPAAFLNNKEDGPHVPGPSAAAISFLVEQRNVNGWGVEAVGTDAGQAFAFQPMFPAHHLMHGANKFGLASLTNLDLLPPTGAVIVTAPLKIEKGSGSPLRVLALVAA